MVCHHCVPHARPPQQPGNDGPSASSPPIAHGYYRNDSRRGSVDCAPWRRRWRLGSERLRLASSWARRACRQAVHGETATGAPMSTCRSPPNGSWPQSSPIEHSGKKPHRCYRDLERRLRLGDSPSRSGFVPTTAGAEHCWFRRHPRQFGTFLFSPRRHSISHKSADPGAESLHARSSNSTKSHIVRTNTKFVVSI